MLSRRILHLKASPGGNRMGKSLVMAEKSFSGLSPQSGINKNKPEHQTDTMNFNFFFHFSFQHLELPWMAHTYG